MKKMLLAAGCLLGAMVLFALGLVGYLSLTEYKPEAVEALEITAVATKPPLETGRAFSVLSFNIGYGALGADSDFFMDGGKEVRPDSAAVVEENLAGIRGILDKAQADFYLLQEVDVDSKRSYGLDETAYLSAGRQVDAAHALNFSCAYVPYPLPTIGKVHSGLYTMSGHDFARDGEGAQRIALPNPFAWPVRMANLKRCLLVNRIPVAGTEKELVLVNLHLEAYDDGEGKAAQTAVLMELLEAEYQKGNYVIAGGDFNCSFPVVDGDAWPIVQAGNYVPGVIEADALPAGFQWAVDGDTPTCRLLDRPLQEEGHQFYVIDGFILSPNVELRAVETLAENFQYSDHNPVLLQAALLP